MHWEAMKKMKRYYRPVALAACLVSAGLFTAYGAVNPPSEVNPPSQSDVMNQVQHKLAGLAYYTVFDNLAYRVNGTQVTLMGQVVNPVLKDDAATAVKEIGGVTAVINEIQILPPSTMDAGIRRAVFRAIYRDPALMRYGEPTVPSIHIIVNNGSVTLTGMVASQSDKEEAYIRANSVPGTFGVNNDLMVNPSA